MEILRSAIQGATLDADPITAKRGTHSQKKPPTQWDLRDEGVDEEALQWVAPIIGLMQQMREDDVGNPPRAM